MKRRAAKPVQRDDEEMNSGDDSELEEIYASSSSSVSSRSPSPTGLAPSFTSTKYLKESVLKDGSTVPQYREIDPDYNSDSSTEEAPNRTGDIPSHWYDDLPHLGYDVDGKMVMRPAIGDALDKFLQNEESDFTTAHDKSTGTDVQLSAQELDIIKRLQNAEIPDAAFNPYQDTIEWYTSKQMVMPLSAKQEPKSRFVKSKWEHAKIMKIVRSIRSGRILPSAPRAAKPEVYAIWSNADEPRAEHAMHMPAPSMPAPGHEESYNPPEEYVPTPEEVKQQREDEEANELRPDFVPQKFDSFRAVPAYKEFVNERFNRLLDLYLAPRIRRTKLSIDPHSLIPKLPSPAELRPYPSYCASIMRPTSASAKQPRIRSVSLDPTGTWLATGSEDGSVSIWEVAIGRCAKTWSIAPAGSPVHSVQWCSNPAYCILAAAVVGKIYLLSPSNLIPPALANKSSSHLSEAFSNPVPGAVKAVGVEWTRPNEQDRHAGILVVITVLGTPKQVAWHRKGDYFSSVSPDSGNKAVFIHQISKHQSQSPFKRTKGTVQKVAFHPTKPHFFVVTQRYVRLYDLVAQSLLKTLTPGLKWLSSVDVHPRGDNLIVGSYDKKLCWFDLDLGEKPLRTLRYHSKAIRSVCYHPTLPLFASASDDGTIHVFHASVQDDLSSNALIVPLKVLKGHKIKDGLGVLDMCWHGREPWLMSVGADGDARLWCE